MELQSQKKDHISLNDGDAVNFDIADDFVSHAIQMLTKQYSDPEMAFIRETCSNAYDAHTAAGNEDTPFDLHIPSTFEPYIEIRDYGTGISKDFMLNRYVSVGDSTKRKSNTEIGGFGIGRLSFLIVTEQAAITSYFEGVKYSYNIRYNEVGTLVMSQTDERPTDEPNGLRLKFPVQVNRVEAFRQAAKKYFQRVTSTAPNFLGEKLEIQRTTYTHTGTGWGIRAEDGTSDLYAIMGNIAYPVRTNTLRYDDRFTEVNSVLDSRIDLFFDIGGVAPLPTRENLDMCEHTIEALLERLKVVKEELMARVEVDIAKAKNMWQAERAYNSLLSGMSRTMSDTIRGMDLKFQGSVIRKNAWRFDSPEKEIEHSTRLDGDGNPLKVKVKTLAFHARGRSGHNATRPTSWQREQDYVYANHRDFLQHCFVYNDTGKGIRPTIDHNFPNRDTKVVMVSGPAEAWQEFKTIQTARGFNPRGFRLASKLLPKPKRPRSLPDKAAMAYLRADRTLPSYVGVKSMTYSTTYGEHTGQKRYYVLASNYQLSEADHAKMQELKAYCKIGMLDRIDILVLNKNRQNLMKDEADWVHFSDYVKVDEKKVAAKRKQVYRAVYYAMHYNRMYQLIADNCSESVTTDRERWNTDTDRGWGKVLNWKGRLVRDSAGVPEAVQELHYFISKYGTYLETLKTDGALGQLATSVIGNNYDIGFESIETLCTAYGIDFEKLKTAGSVTRQAETRIEEMLSSQTYFLLKKMKYESNFDFEQLKKELST